MEESDNNADERIAEALIVAVVEEERGDLPTEDVLPRPPLMEHEQRLVQDLANLICLIGNELRNNQQLQHDQKRAVTGGASKRALAPSTPVSEMTAQDRTQTQDLVAWVTAGFLHIPHAEDIPNTVTVGNGGGLLLRPHNYFNEDPSMDSPDSVYLDPGSESSCESNHMACVSQDSCAPEREAFSYNGFEGVMKFHD